MVYDDGCERCAAAKSGVEDALREIGVSGNIRLVKVDDAGDLSLEHNLTVVPSFVVNGVGFNKQALSRADIRLAMLHGGSLSKLQGRGVQPSR